MAHSGKIKDVYNVAIFVGSARELSVYRSEFMYIHLFHNYRVGSYLRVYTQGWPVSYNTLAFTSARRE